jgi:hypothetical protein
MIRTPSATSTGEALEPNGAQMLTRPPKVKYVAAAPETVTDQGISPGLRVVAVPGGTNDAIGMLAPAGRA